MFRKRNSISGNDAKFFPKEDDPSESILYNSKSDDHIGVLESKTVEDQNDSQLVDKAFKMEATVDAFPDLGNDKKKDAALHLFTDLAKERTKEKEELRKLSSHSHNSRKKNESENPGDNDIAEFMKLVERSRSSTEMKTLLMKILNENKIEELKPFLKSSSRKESRASLDSTSNHDKIKKHSTRRSVRTGQELRTGASRRDLLASSSHSSKNGTRRNIRTRNIERGTRTSDDPVSPGSGLTRSRHSETPLRKKQRDLDSDSAHQKSKPTATKSSTLHDRPNRRSDMIRRQSMSHLVSEQMSPGDRNSSWDKKTVSLGVIRGRATSANNMTMPQAGTEDNHNATWDAPKLASRRDSVDKLRLKSLRNLNIDIDEDDEESADGDEAEKKDPLSPEAKIDRFDSSTPLGRRGKVGIRKHTDGINDLLDDLRLNRDSTGSTKEVDDEEDARNKKKNNIRRFLSRQLSIKNFTGKEKLTNSSEFVKMSNSDAPDGEKNPGKDVNEDSYSSLYGD
eukprot:CAMPEP_0172379430 /NCGR_PEP_ID=MMETSP1060-20121228/69928_1 /TAXON_ID=37318 /ORGANISM="Pseudo-nitzschia pungens, Strain cf. cingulata" /LENGTH=508 /DNA_ID=CAMNT_0013107171 /DNA_START=145 /DNA_END=1671 /DNA_ORIENTATION=+